MGHIIWLSNWYENQHKVSTTSPPTILLRLDDDVIFHLTPMDCHLDNSLPSEPLYSSPERAHKKLMLPPPPPAVAPRLIFGPLGPNACTPPS